MRLFSRPIASAVMVCLATSTAASAHENLHAQIEALTGRINSDSANARLYLQRGELHRLHEDWDAALADYECAGRLDPGNHEVLFARGRMLAEAGWPESGLAALDAFLATHPEHGRAHLARARALTKVARYVEAVGEYTIALEHPEDREPGYYLERARAQAAAGDEHLPEAIAGLDEGVAYLGPVVSLQLYAIELDLRLKRGDAALERLDRVIERMQRTEKWSARRGRILEQLQRRTEAAEAYTQALAAIAALPTRHRQVRTTKELEETVRAALLRLDSAGADGDEHRLLNHPNMETEN